MAGFVARLLGCAILLRTVVLGNEERKGVSGPGEYFMGYYTIWLLHVKRFLRPVLGISEKAELRSSDQHGKVKTHR